MLCPEHPDVKALGLWSKMNDQYNCPPLCGKCNSLHHHDEDCKKINVESDIIKSAQHERLNQGLETLSDWCKNRADGDYNIETTLSMLETMARQLRGRVVDAGLSAINEYIKHNGKDTNS